MENSVPLTYTGTFSRVIETAMPCNVISVMSSKSAVMSTPENVVYVFTNCWVTKPPERLVFPIVRNLCIGKDDGMPPLAFPWRVLQAVHRI